MSYASNLRHLRLGDVEHDSPDVAHDIHDYPYADRTTASQRLIRMRIGQTSAPAKGAVMEIVALVNALLTEAKMRQQELADGLGVSQSTIARLRKGDQEPSYQLGLKIIEIAGKRGLLTETMGASTLTHKVEVRGRMIGSDTISLFTNDQALQQIELPFPVPVGCFAFTVEADGLTSRARQGDLIIVGPMCDDPSSMIETEGAIFIADNICVYGLLVAGGSPTQFTIVCQHSRIVPNVVVKSVGPFFAVIAAGRWQTLKSS